MAVPYENIYNYIKYVHIQKRKNKKLTLDVLDSDRLIVNSFLRKLFYNSYIYLIRIKWIKHFLISLMFT